MEACLRQRCSQSAQASEDVIAWENQQQEDARVLFQVSRASTVLLAIRMDLGASSCAGLNVGETALGALTNS